MYNVSIIVYRPLKSHAFWVELIAHAINHLGLFPLQNIGME